MEVWDFLKDLAHPPEPSSQTLDPRVKTALEEATNNNNNKSIKKESLKSGLV